jgi:hypothetical protein
MLSGDFSFANTPKSGCWQIHVLVRNLVTEANYHTGYVVSYVVLDPSGMCVYHGVAAGPQSIFDDAMRKAAAVFAKVARASSEHR